MRTLAELVPLRTGPCRDAVDAVSTIAAGEDGADAGARAHVEQCLRCQAEVAAFRRVLRLMATMQDDPVALAMAGHSTTPPKGPAEPVGNSALAAFGWTRRAACVGGLTAGAAGMYVWLSRR